MLRERRKLVAAPLCEGPELRQDLKVVRNRLVRNRLVRNRLVRRRLERHAYPADFSKRRRAKMHEATYHLEPPTISVALA